MTAHHAEGIVQKANLFNPDAEAPILWIMDGLVRCIECDHISATSLVMQYARSHPNMYFSS